jgi:hypothetical protein
VSPEGKGLLAVGGTGRSSLLPVQNPVKRALKDILALTTPDYFEPLPHVEHQTRALRIYVLPASRLARLRIDKCKDFYRNGQLDAESVEGRGRGLAPGATDQCG